MNYNPLISVIIPCFNQGKYLLEAIESIIVQTYTRWEIIIVNDGSTDNTAEIACGFIAKDKRIKYIQQNNIGLAGARNKGLEEAIGNYIQFLDADDLIDPEKFEFQVNELLDISEAAICISDYYSCDILNAKKTVHRYLSPRFLGQDPLLDLACRWETELSIPVHCFLFDSRFFKQHKIRFDETLPNHEDWDCWMRIFALRPVVKYIDQKLAIYRIHYNSMCYDRVKMRYGFLKALHKQKKILKKNRLLNGALIQKKKNIKYIYQDTCLLFRFLKYLSSPFRRFLNKLIVIF